MTPLSGPRPRPLGLPGTETRPPVAGVHAVSLIRRVMRRLVVSHLRLFLPQAGKIIVSYKGKDVRILCRFLAWAVLLVRDIRPLKRDNTSLRAPSRPVTHTRLFDGFYVLRHAGVSRSLAGMRPGRVIWDYRTTAGVSGLGPPEPRGRCLCSDLHSEEGSLMSLHKYLQSSHVTVSGHSGRTEPDQSPFKAQMKKDDDPHESSERV